MYTYGMTRRKFKLWHSLVGMLALVVLEGIALEITSAGYSNALILLVAAVGAGVMIYVATEVVEEVRGTPHMLVLLSAVVAEFIVFFAFEYAYMLASDLASFPSLTLEPVTLALQSTMVFVFNPLYMPSSVGGQALLLINTLGALALVLFILQNIWQIRTNRS
jgi:hypothetical protein